MRSVMTWLHSDRLLSRSQKLLRDWRFPEALLTLDEALLRNPTRVGLLLYRGRALSELGRYDEASDALETVTALQTRNHALPLMLGCVYMDAGRLADASNALSKSGSLDPGNELVAALQQLVAYRMGNSSALAGLQSKVSHLSCEFSARLLASLPATPTSHWFNVALDDPDPHTAQGRLRAFLRRLSLLLRERRTRATRAKALQLFDRDRNEEVVDLLTSQLAPSELTAELREFLKKARARAIAELTAKQSSSAGPRVRKSSKRDASRRRIANRVGVRVGDRAFIAQLVRMRDPADISNLRSDYERWLESFRLDKEPKRERHGASDVTTELARIALLDGKPAEAIALCEQARLYRPTPEIDWLQAVASVAIGEPALSRRYFERYGSQEELHFRERVRARLSHCDQDVLAQPEL